LFDVSGRRIDATPAFRREAQRFYLERLLAEASESVRKQAQRMRAIQPDPEIGLDEFTLDSLVIDWLIAHVEPADAAYLRSKNRTLRLGYFRELYPKRVESLDGGTGLPPEILEFGRDKGFLALATTAAGAEYIAECREAGVPIPPTWGTDAWTYEGDIATNFIGRGDPASVYSFESKQPDGLCIALPRIVGPFIDALGIICLGRETSNVCFWDKTSTPLREEVPISRFRGGADLVDVCSDCHAGRNPFVVHPGDAMDLGAKLRTRAWYTPLVRPDWPQNPGPSGLPEIVPLQAPGDRRCTECHQPARDGRFPEFGALPGYCEFVLSPAIAQTMPKGNPRDPDFQTHARRLLAFCAQDPPSSKEVPGSPFREDPAFVSPPVALGPLYPCAEAIEVRGGIRHARLEVSVNAVALPPVEALDPDRQVVRVPPLRIDDVVEVRQVVAGVPSSPTSTRVHDPDVDFPNGLPKPEIDPTVIYECGNVIAVRHLRGARVTVRTNGGRPVTYSTSGDWTNLAPAIRPFGRNHTYTAQYDVCGEPSPPSEPESAGPAPNTVPMPALEPPAPFQGQELVNVANLLNGARTTVAEASAGTLVDFSTAVSWQPNLDLATRLGRPLRQSDALVVESTLCQAGPRLTVTGARSCSELPAPAIQQPFVGQNVVTVTRAIPGARIRVFDQQLIEIGDGSGSPIRLRRTLQPRDVLTVLQQIGECTSRTGYQVTVLCTEKGQGC
jgi:hypothetical protein